MQQVTTMPVSTQDNVEIFQSKLAFYGGAENMRLETPHQTAGLENAGLENARTGWLWKADQA